MAARQHALITVGQLLALGLDTSAVAKRVARGALHRRYRGVYVVGQPALSPEGERLAAVLAAGPGAALARLAAAELHAISRFHAARITVVTTSKRRPDGVDVHRVRMLDRRDITTHRGIPVTTVHRTLVDLADVLTPHQLANVIHEAAYPEPLVNTDLHGFEVDFHWPEHRLAVELDGAVTRRATTPGATGSCGPPATRCCGSRPNLARVDPLSQSPIWTMQRAFYEQRAGEAFAEIPHEAVDNPWVAAAYARVIKGFARDLSASPTIVELGAGTGRFAHGLRRELGGDVRYVMTDFAQSQLDDWAANPALEDFEFARYDLTTDAAPVRGPLVVIANYVFDSLPADAFAVHDGVLEECLVEVTGDLELRYSRRPTTPEHYGDPDLDALLEHYRANLGDTVFTIPRTALAALRMLREASNDRLLLLAADKAFSTEESLGYREEPQPARHSGAFSLMVNFHALGLYAQRHGGTLLHGGDRHAAIDVGAFVFGPSRETRAAYEEALGHFGPGDLATLTAGVERVADGLTVAEIVALLRLSGWNATTLHAVLGPLHEHAADADPATQEDLREALMEIDDRHFPIPGEPDLPFAIGLLLYELQDYEDAIEYFEASLEQHGHDPATEKNIALCQAMLD